MPGQQRLRIAARWLSRPKRFGLRTLFLLTTACAVAAWYWLAPRPPEKLLPGGFRIRASVRMVDLRDGFGGYTAKEQFHGKCNILDPRGNTVAAGQFDDGVAVGRWTFFHPNGRRASSGDCAKSGRIGTWMSWDERGSLINTIVYKEVEQLDGYGWGPPPPISVRQGPFQGWWPNGRLRVEGTFEHDKRQGLWVFFGEQGPKLAQGDYYLDQRNGTWQFWNSAGTPESKFYFRGQFHPEGLEAALKSTAHQLLRSATDQDVGGICDAMVALGEVAAPTLQETLQSASPATASTLLQSLGSIEPAAAWAIRLVRTCEDSSDDSIAIIALCARYRLDESRRTDTVDRIVNRLITIEHSNDDERAQQLSYRINEVARCGKAIPPELSRVLDDPDRDRRHMAFRLTLLWKNTELSASLKEHWDPAIAGAAVAAEQH